MFGMNEIVGKKYFKEAPENSLLVTSRFYTIQGEGPFRGEPALFLRLAKCNLSCSFCDTYFDKGTWMTYDEILKDFNHVYEDFFIKRNLKVPPKIETREREPVIVITGGEPTLQPNLYGFIENLFQLDYIDVQIETNGTQTLNVPDYTVVVVSPKCLEKNGVAIRYLKPRADVLEKASCLKFVVSAPEENDQYSPYSSIPSWAFDCREDFGTQIYVSPMNIYKKEPQKAKELRAQNKEISIDERSNVDEVISFWEEGLLDMEKNRRNHEYAAELALRYGCVFNLQTHLYASLP